MTRSIRDIREQVLFEVVVIFAGMAAWQPDAWDVDVEVGRSGLAGDLAEDPAEQLPHEAGADLADFLLHLRTTGKLVARDVCVICHYASLAGAQGPVRDIVWPPDGHHFTRHLETCQGMGKGLEGQYNMQCPGFDKFDASRVALNVPCLPLHEALSAEHASKPELMSDLLAKSLNNVEWSARYRSNPVVQRAEAWEFVMPIALYSDGIPFQKRDSTLSFFAYNLLTGVRHCLVNLRKSEMCQCGCLGWCTISVVWHWLRWSIEALAAGHMPSMRHDRSEFLLPEDTDRAARAGKALTKGAIVMIKADWQEYAKGLGLPYWSNLMHPCFCCHASRDQLQFLGSFGPSSAPFKAKVHREYEEACAACEIWIDVRTKREHQLLIGTLFFDRRPHGNQGRCLKQDLFICGTQLRAGDRLELCDSLFDIGKFEDISIPGRVLFWRPSNTTLATRRCPVFVPAAGVTIECCVVDPMHTLHLGVYKDVCQSVLWALLLGDCFKTNATGASLPHLGLLRMRAHLMAWYTAEKARCPDVELYALQDLKMSMLGSANDQTCATKAAETGTLLQYCRDALRELGQHRLGGTGKYLLAVCDALVEFRDVQRNEPAIMSRSGMQRLVDTAARAFSLREQAGISFSPKWHMMLHIAVNAKVQGNPGYQTTFLDEDFNGRLKAIAAKTHRLAWHRKLLMKFRWAYSLAGACRKRKH